MNVLLGLAFVLCRGGEAKRTEQCLSFPVLQLESDQMHLIQLTPLLPGDRAAIGYLWTTHLQALEFRSFLKIVFFFDEVCLPSAKLQICSLDLKGILFTFRFSICDRRLVFHQEHRPGLLVAGLGDKTAVTSIGILSERYRKSFK